MICHGYFVASTGGKPLASVNSSEVLRRLRFHLVLSVRLLRAGLLCLVRLFYTICHERRKMGWFVRGDMQIRGTRYFAILQYASIYKIQLAWLSPLWKRGAGCIPSTAGWLQQCRATGSAQSARAAVF